MIDGKDLIPFVQVLAGLKEVGLTPEQTQFLNKKFGLSLDDVRDLLDRAEESYAGIQNLFSKGHRILTDPMSCEQAKQVFDQNPENPMVQGIVFPTTEDLGISWQTESRNAIISGLAVGSEWELGSVFGFEYEPLLTSIPYSLEGDIPPGVFED